MLSESLSSSASKNSVFSRLGAEKGPEKSSIFARLGNASGLDSVNPRRRVTIGGDSIETNVSRNIISLKPNNMKKGSNSRLVTKTVANSLPKKPISAPTSQMRSTRTETVSVKNRIGLMRNSKPNTVPTSNRLIVNRIVNTKTPTASPAVAQAKRIAAMRRAADSTNNRKRTISLRKNIFDRLGPISL